jgi:hypothetical protein
MQGEVVGIEAATVSIEEAEVVAVTLVEVVAAEDAVAMILMLGETTDASSVAEVGFSILVTSSRALVLTRACCPQPQQRTCLEV